MYLHRYYFKLIKESKTFLETLILIKVEGNEKASVAVDNSKKYMEAVHKLSDYQYEMDYRGVTKADKFQETLLEKHGYVMIPFENTDVKQSEL